VFASSAQEVFAVVSFTDAKGNYKLWRVFLNLAAQKPSIFWIFLGIQFLVVLLTYSGQVGFGSALLIAFLLDLFWLIVFIGLPALFQFLMGLVVLILAIGITILIVQNLGSDSFVTILLVFVISFVVLFILFALISIAIYLLPGFLVGMAVYSATDSNGWAIAAFVVTTIVFIVLVAIFTKYILPFVFGYALNWVSVVIANQIAVAIVLGISAYSFYSSGNYNDLSYSGLYNTYGDISSLFSLLKSMLYLPGAIGVWSFISGIFCGVLNTPFRAYILATGEARPTSLRNAPKTPLPPPPLPAQPQTRSTPPPPIPGTYAYHSESIASSIPPLPNPCKNCGEVNSPGAVFCGRCGARLD
jgi:hypothetical protein